VCVNQRAAQTSWRGSEIDSTDGAGAIGVGRAVSAVVVSVSAPLGVTPEAGVVAHNYHHCNHQHQGPARVFIQIINILDTKKQCDFCI
jgi:hypothetical protein